MRRSLLIVMALLLGSALTCGGGELRRHRPLGRRRRVEGLGLHGTAPRGGHVTSRSPSERGERPNSGR